MASPTLVRDFPAMEPQFVFQFNSYAEAETTWINPLEIIRRAAVALTEDAAMFRAMGYDKSTAGDEFLRSLAYYQRAFVQGSLRRIEHALEAYTKTPAQTGTKGSIGSGLAEARLAVDRLSAVTKPLFEAKGLQINVAPCAGDMVPTASPYQLLYQRIAIDRLSSAPAGHSIAQSLLMLQKQAGLALPKLPDGIVKVTSESPCGRPTMMFIAGSMDLSRFVMGANGTAWDSLTPVSAITRAARDVRLQHYIPRAMAAFQALRQKEGQALAELKDASPNKLKHNPSADSGSASTSAPPKDVEEAKEDPELVWRARSTAIRLMRSDPSMLGGEEEMGIAFKTPGWPANQGCYLCQGMMAYQSPRQWTENQQRKYILQFS